MKRQVNETIDSLTAVNADERDTAMTGLADLPVADEQAEEIKGGPDNLELTVKVLNAR